MTVSSDSRVRQESAHGDAEPALERERNRLLRRADWRYLLPNTLVRRALCFGGPQLRASCGIVTELVDTEPEPGILYDLVAAEDPDDAMLRLLSRWMSPIGACYVEWRAVGPGGVHRLRRRLERAGFHDPRCYQPWPSITRTRAWIPTAEAAASHFWRRAVRSSRVRRDQLRDGVGWALASLGVRPRVGVVALGAAAASTDTAPQLVRLAREHSAIPGASRGIDDPHRVSLLLLTTGERSVGKVVALLFDASDRPAVAIKTARVRESAAGLLHEAELLDSVHSLHPGGMAGVPRILFRAEARGEPVIGETALTGVPLAASLDRRSYPAIAERVTTWLSALAAPAVDSPWQDPWDRLIAPTLDRFESEFAAVIEPAQMRRTRELLREFDPLPLVCEQRDFSPWNVFDGENGIVVLDWESGEACGLPALDLVYFLTHAAYYLENAWTSGKFEEAYRAAWTANTAIAHVNDHCMNTYLDRLRLSTHIVPALRLFAWIMHAHSDYLHLRADAGGLPGAGMLRSSRFFRLYNTELRGGASR